ncbi:MAG: Glycosyl transferase, family 2 [Nitrosospira sp.]
MSAIPIIDAVIPVFNAPALTRRCVDSVVAHLGCSIRYIHIQDDASEAETREMLDQLPYESVRIFHAPKNQGFGKSVNDAVARSDAAYVLILNSDTVASEDFLPALCAVFSADPQLAVIIPAGNEYTKYEWEKYRRLPGGYVQTHRLRGYAFLIRRNVFSEIGGFDSLFGRGYYEDVDLGRRLALQGWRLGVYPEARIEHKGGGSFGRGRSFKELARHNRNLYLSRYPDAGRHILLISGTCSLTQLPPELLHAVDNVFQHGGYMDWLAPRRSWPLLCLQMRAGSLPLVDLARLFIYNRYSHRCFREIWILPDAPRLLAALFAFCARKRGVKIVSWKWS